MHGRERWEVEAIYRDPDLARELEITLSHKKGILSVSANAVSGRVLVMLDPNASGIHVEQLIKACLKNILQKGVPKNSSIAKASPLMEILKIGIPERGMLVGPLVLSGAEHSLSILQDLSLVGILNTARGQGPGFLKLFGLKKLTSRVTFMTALSLVITVANLGVQYFRKRAWQKLSQDATKRIRAAVIKKIEYQDLAFFDSHETGHLLRSTTQDIAQLGDFIENAGNEAIHKTLNILASGLILFSASPALAFLVCLPLPFIVATNRYFAKVAKTRYARSGEASSRFVQSLQNNLSGIADVKSFTAEEQEVARMYGYGEQMSIAQMEAASVSSLQTQLSGSIASVGFLVASGYGAQMASSEKISLSEYIQAVFWFPQFLRSLAGLEGIMKLYYDAQNAASELTEILNSRSTILDGPVRMQEKQGEIIFKDVSFGYTSSKKILDGVSFQVDPGETIAIVGPTGSGKSTLLKLLLRFYDLSSGSISLDGTDIRQLHLKELRSSVSVVSQDVHLFQGSVRENIVYGHEDASDEEIAEAMEDSAVTNVIGALPGGLDAEVGERGQRLSGGERQRVAIARALVKLSRGASILAMDEATSQLDNQTETTLQQSLHRATAGKSVIVVAHRLSTIRTADRIIVLERGKIVEQGTHRELLKLAGLYASLWRLQEEGALGGGLEVRVTG
jgi:ATP-binding cassette, subfamily B, bacterial